MIEFSDEFELNEIECVAVWVDASDSSKRRLVEQHTGKRYGSLDLNIPAAAREIFHLQKDFQLAVVTELMRARYDTTLIPEKRKVIMMQTNRLLCSGVGGNLIRSLLNSVGRNGSGIVALLRKHGVGRHGRERSETQWAHVQRRLLQMAACILFTFYETQIEAEELRDLQELLGWKHL